MADRAEGSAPARVLIVDDDELAREALISVLGGEPDLEVVGEAVDGESATVLADALRPDLVLMDVRMPGLDGLAATRAIKAALPATRVLLLTTYDTQEYVLEGLRTGADGYLLKGASKQELHVSLNTVKTHVVHLLRRLEVTDRTQAAVRAAQLGLLDDAPSGPGGTC